MYVEQNFISKEQAKEISKSLANNLGGYLPENRVMIVTPNNTDVKVGNILLPNNTDKKDLPRKGVIVQIGCLSEDNIYYKDLLSIGRILTYGMYAGKELDFPQEIFSTVKDFNMDDHTFTVLSIQEIIYSELNKK